MVYAVLTEDMDILTFGSPIIIRNFISNHKNPIQITLNTILNKLNLSYNQFIELCILFGCDYCYHIKNIKPNDIYNIYIKTKSIEKTLDELKNMGYNIGDNYDYTNAIQYFINASHIHIEENQLELNKPNIDKLFNLLVNKYNLNKYIINIKLNRLNIYYNNLKSI